jgi:hypothetical protein
MRLELAPRVLSLHLRRAPSRKHESLRIPIRCHGRPRRLQTFEDRFFRSHRSTQKPGFFYRAIQLVQAESVEWDCLSATSPFAPPVSSIHLCASAQCAFAQSGRRYLSGSRGPAVVQLPAERSSSSAGTFLRWAQFFRLQFTSLNHRTCSVSPRVKTAHRDPWHKSRTRQLSNFWNSSAQTIKQMCPKTSPWGRHKFKPHRATLVKSNFLPELSGLIDLPKPIPQFCGSLRLHGK